MWYSESLYNHTFLWNIHTLTCLINLLDLEGLPILCLVTKNELKLLVPWD